jgi:hypothetical protein
MVSLVCRFLPVTGSRIKDSRVTATVDGAWHLAQLSRLRKGYLAIGMGIAIAFGFVDRVLLIGTTTQRPRFVRCFERTTQGRFSIISGGLKPIEKSQTRTVPSMGENVIQ